MAFVLSKIFWLIFRPLNLVIFMIIGGMLIRLVARKSTRLQRFGGGLIGLSAFVMIVLGFTNIPDYLLYSLENRADVAEISEKPAGIIVLGGGLNSHITRQRNIKYAMSDAGERLIAAFELSNKYPDIPLVYSGGPAKRNVNRDPETLVAQNIAKALYGDKKSIIAENKSRNTWENAVFLKRLLNPKPDEKWIVVTSAYHAFRSAAIFKKIGFEVHIFPTNYRAEYVGNLSVVGNAVVQFGKADLVLKEYFGIIAYWLMGRLDWPFG